MLTPSTTVGGNTLNLATAAGTVGPLYIRQTVPVCANTRYTLSFQISATGATVNAPLAATVVGAPAVVAAVPACQIQALLAGQNIPLPVIQATVPVATGTGAMVNGTLTPVQTTFTLGPVAATSGILDIILTCTGGAATLVAPIVFDNIQLQPQPFGTK